MTSRIPTRQARPSEEGYVLVAVIFLMVILVISLSVAVPKVREDIQRDRDLETMQRGKQYIRAIQLYYRKFNAYPPNVDALIKTNNVRFLRKKYIDPTTGKDLWKPVLFGQNKTPLAMGFFGQPLAANGIAGIGPGGGSGLAGTMPGSGVASSTGSGLFNSGSTTSSTDAGNGANGTSGTSGTSGTDANGNPTSGTGSSTGSTSSSTGTGSSTTGTGPASNSGIGSTSNGTGPTFGGAGIIGFSPGSPKQSILVYKKKNHYNEWEFLYSKLADQMIQTGGNTGLIGQPAGGANTPMGGTPMGGTPTMPTAPTTPITPTNPTPVPQQ
jgi:type II secretory pathway pseudopilin PulG